MNLSMPYNALDINQDNEVALCFLKHEETIINFLTEGVRQNFFDYIHGQIHELEPFFKGVKRAIYHLLSHTVKEFIEGKRIKKEAMIPLTRHANKKKEVGFNELMLDFPVEFSLYNLHSAYYEGLFEELKLSHAQEDDFAKGVCLGSHVTCLFIWYIFRFEVFQDFTFQKIIKDYTHKQVYLIYPELMKKLAITRVKGFGRHLILKTHPMN
jgi:hypothetical protein